MGYDTGYVLQISGLTAFIIATLYVLNLKTIPDQLHRSAKRITSFLFVGGIVSLLIWWILINAGLRNEKIPVFSISLYAILLIQSKKFIGPLKITKPFQSRFRKVKQIVWIATCLVVIFFIFVLFRTTSNRDNVSESDREVLDSNLRILSIIYLLMMVIFIISIIEFESNKRSNLKNKEDFSKFYTDNSIKILGYCHLCYRPIPYYQGLMKDFVKEEQDKGQHPTTEKVIPLEMEFYIENEICLQQDKLHNEWLDNQKLTVQEKYSEDLDYIINSWKQVNRQFLILIGIAAFLYFIAYTFIGPNTHSQATDFQDGVDQYPEFYAWTMSTIINSMNWIWIPIIIFYFLNDRAVLAKKLYWIDR